MTKDIRFVASAAFGVERIVVRELEEIGYAGARVEDGRIHFQGDLSAVCRTNLWLRCAERIQVVVGDFTATNFDDLFDTVKELPWEEWLSADAKFPVTARCVRSSINSVPSTQKMVKRAIVERLRKVYSRHWFAETGPEFKIDCNIVNNRALIMLDSTGEGLHKRGYRQLVSAAPLRETIAAALVKLSYWNHNRLLIDPFCGSGTIPIEAAMIARNLAPGRHREFASEQWPQLRKSLWADARQEVRDTQIPHLAMPIMARDRDSRIIKAARQNAQVAGVSHDIMFETKEFYTFPTDRDYGVMITNPPYGLRIGEEEEVKQLHSDMRELLADLDTWSLYILTAAERFEREFGRKADRRRKLFNARIPCTYYQYLGPKPPLMDGTLASPPSEEEAMRDSEPQLGENSDDIVRDHDTLESDMIDEAVDTESSLPPDFDRESTSDFDTEDD